MHQVDPSQYPQVYVSPTGASIVFAPGGGGFPPLHVDLDGAAFRKLMHDGRKVEKALLWTHGRT